MTLRLVAPSGAKRLCCRRGAVGDRTSAMATPASQVMRKPHAQDFVLKGGLLLGAYGVRRPTKDADSNAISADVTPAHLRRVVQDIAAVEARDGVQFLLDTLAVADIRENASYPGVRVRVRATVGNWQGGQGCPNRPASDGVARLLPSPAEIPPLPPA
ncbi:nucleotidyl transferase AbiEii/AbiGii toxin family protein [Microbacterium sp. Leaf151]|uniref:nucleotidyl transferase AbiEii/AbiGii toxin family protein n=1 Tax=Microbacterium sp. Leaf151 TaxID=1736276 RepID=UPI00138EF142